MPDSYSTRDASPARHRRCRSAPDSYLRRASPLPMQRWPLDKNSMGGKGKESIDIERNSLNQEILMLERRLHDQFYLRWALENALGYRSTSLFAKDVSPIPKAAAELIKEIAVLEVEVLNLERYLLSLYRMAFDHRSNNFSSADLDQSSTLPLTCHEKSIHRDNEATEGQDDLQVLSRTMSVPNYSHSSTNSCHSIGSPRQIDFRMQQKTVSLSRSVSDTDKWNSPSRYNYEGSDGCHLRPRSLAKDIQTSRTTSLADHLGTSIADHVTGTPNMLSEDILRCMSAIYCKLANPHLPHAGLISSPTSSLSSGSTFSPQDHCDNWSPRCNTEAATSPCHTSELGENHGPYSAMVKVPWIHVDGDRLSYAAQILQKFRSLVQRLEKVDPRKMKHEEKLAFWINIHNALVMHAYLAYGIPTNHSKREPLILKAAYSVGGQSINAYLIQTSILGCCRQTSASWLLQTLLSPGSKSRLGNDKHAYAIEHPEPLLHFALSLGGRSDPAVRIYTAKRIFKELEIAKEEYIQSNICMPKETKIILPKIINYYARDAALNLSGLLDAIHDCLSEAQQKALQKCIDVRSPKNVVQFRPYNYVFRYIIHRELAKV